MASLALLAAASVRYVVFGNARYGFFLDRPTFLAPQRPPDNGDGQEFRSGATILRAYGAMNVESKTAGTLLKAWRAEAKDGTIRLAVAKDGWAAFSYAKAGTIHYEKAFVTKDAIRTVEFEYPTAAAPQMAPVVTHVVRSFRPTPTSFVG